MSLWVGVVVLAIIVVLWVVSLCAAAHDADEALGVPGDEFARLQRDAMQEIARREAAAAARVEMHQAAWEAAWRDALELAQRAEGKRGV